MKTNKLKEDIMLNIGGIKQYLNVISNDINNPVILFLHGGPGISERKIFEKFCLSLTKSFTIVNHDQRITGKTLPSSSPSKKININQFIKDEIQVIDFLREKFNKQKIYIIGHCWGSILGLHLVHIIPEKIEKYIGVGQMINMELTEEITYKNTLDEAIRRNDKKAIKKLRKIGYPIKGLYKNIKDVKTRYFYSVKYGGQFHKFNLNTIRMLLSFSSPRSFLQTYNGIKVNLEYIWDDISKTDFFKLDMNMKIPIYFFIGKYDGIAPPILVEEYYNLINSPDKDIIYFKNSAHMVFTEEPRKFNKMVINKFSK